MNNDINNDMIMDSDSDSDSSSDEEEINWIKGSSLKVGVNANHRIVQESESVNFNELKKEEKRENAKKENRKNVMIRYTKKDKDLTSSLHKCSLLGYICYLRKFNEIINNEYLRNLIFSIIPIPIINSLRVLNVVKYPARSDLRVLIDWYCGNFRALGKSEVDSDEYYENGFLWSDIDRMETVLHKRVGTQQEIIQLFLSILRCFNIRSRLVITSDPYPIQPTYKFDYSNIVKNLLKKYTPKLKNNKRTASMIKEELYEEQQRELNKTNNMSILDELQRNDGQLHQNNNDALENNNITKNVEVIDIEEFEENEKKQAEMGKELNDIIMKINTKAEKTKRKIKDQNRFWIEILISEPRSTKSYKNETKHDVIVIDDDDDDDDDGDDIIDLTSNKRRKQRKEKMRKRKKIGGSSNNQWLFLDVLSTRFQSLDDIKKSRSIPISYAFSIDENDIIKDVTSRYTRDWDKTLQSRIEKAHKDSNWLENTISSLNDKLYIHDEDDSLLLDIEEDSLLNEKKKNTKMPTSFKEFERSSIYCLERYLKKRECIYPKIPVGLFRGEIVYKREHISILRTWTNWLRYRRKVIDHEKGNPVRTIKKKRNNNIEEYKLYGIWQTNEWQPPKARNGKVPKNEYGNIELWGGDTSCLPFGTVYIHSSLAVKVATRLGVDFARAVTGFENKNGQSYPKIEGIVVCEEISEILYEAIDELETERYEKRMKDQSKKNIQAWKKLTFGLLTKHRLEKTYL